jgi:hypothetical protein
MPTKLVKHKVTNGTVGYVFLAPKGLYSGNVGTECGVTEVTGGEADDLLPVVPVKQLLQSKIAKRLTAKVLKGTKTYRCKLVVATTKLASAETGLLNKTIATEGAVMNGGTIEDAYQPLNATAY